MMTNTTTDSYDEKHRKRLINDIFTIIKEFKLSYPDKNIYTLNIQDLAIEHAKYYLAYKQESYKRLFDKQK